ncbi:MAG: S9 family peptidase [Verrucomicrobia subdivision 3 bacterium]|nr:S9 family peptidase [Limisphaerales bacterium]
MKKSEIRMTKAEGNPKSEGSNRGSAGSRFRILDLRASFGFRASDFGFGISDFGRVFGLWPLGFFSVWFLLFGTSLRAQVPENLVVDGIPPIRAELQADAGRYLEFRAAVFNSWHPQKRELLITTRFADSMQLHHVKMPGGARKQLTFLPEPVRGGSFRPGTGDFIVFSQDVGGGEFFQFYRSEPENGKVTLLTDGKSRNTGANWSESGKWIAYTSTRRNGKDNDIYLMNPGESGDASAKSQMLLQVEGGGWSVQDWSPDESKLIVAEYISINESRLYLVDVEKKTKEFLTPKTEEKVSYSQAQFAKDGRSVFITTDKDSEFQRLTRFDLATRQFTVLTKDIAWDVDEFDLSKDGRTIAFITNEDGVGVLHLLDTRSGKELKVPKLPLGVPSNLSWHENSRDLAFNLTSAKSPYDVYSLDVKAGKVERWTDSETGGLDTGGFVEPELIKLKSFDGTPISAFVYRPDPAKFPGKRPFMVNIHGGPEGQSRPGFQARNNYYLNEMGVGIVYPNVRGSSGYGKTYLTLDNGYKREDSVKDIGAILEWAKKDAGIDAQKIAVIGGSYGGYMVLASMTHFADDIKCGVDVVGISNFLTFLKNTQDYRRDLRRVEYGDERDEKMREFLEKISPMTSVKKIKDPLLVVQGKNDPRVPVTESEQMVKAIRDHGGVVWYLMAKDEGHGFAKKRNNDFQFLATILFFKEHLVP